MFHLRLLASTLAAAATTACALTSLGAPLSPSRAHDTTVLTARATTPSAAADSLVVVTWNVHVGGGDIAALVADLRGGALTGAPVSSGFVILLQEAHRTGDEAMTALPGDDGQALHHAPPRGERKDVLEVARRLDLHLAYAPAVPNGRVGPDAPAEDRGVAILSDLPLSGVRAIELPRERQRRVALVGTVRGEHADGTPWSLRVATAHLENRAPWRRALDSFGASRGRQAHALVRGLGEGPLVLGADLNTWGPGFLEPALSVVGRAFPESPEDAGATFTLAGIPRRLDHLFFRLPVGATADVTVAPDRYGSDHAPVVGVVGIGRPADPGFSQERPQAGQPADARRHSASG